MTVPGVLQSEPVTWGMVSLVVGIITIAIAIVLYIVRMRDLERTARTADVAALRTELMVELGKAKTAAYGARDDLRAFELRVAQQYVSHELLTSVRGDIGTVREEVRGVRDLLVEVIREQRPAPRAGGRREAG
ncbi:hypothetical protein [Salinarimonas sp.]|uniref:hypothetical protein n=1 Tax=Salinarimonas sp. TaxID=2766526 RepID=UPI00391DCD66